MYEDYIFVQRSVFYFCFRFSFSDLFPPSDPIDCLTNIGCGWCDELGVCLHGSNNSPDKQKCKSWRFSQCGTSCGINFHKLRFWRIHFVIVKSHQIISIPYLHGQCCCAAPDPCSLHGACTTCTQNRTCGWCARFVLLTDSVWNL